MAVTRAAAVSAALALVGVSALTGCTSDAQPSPMPTPAPSASSSSTPSPTPPSLPAEASGTSPAAAKAFVRHWIAAMNYAGKTGDVDPLRTASSSACVACQAVIKSIAAVYAAGGHYEGDGWRIDTAKYQPLQPRRRPVLAVGVTIARQEVVERRGAEPQRFEGGKRSVTFRLIRVDGAWVLRELEQAA
jgi:hypothetical protein